MDDGGCSLLPPLSLSRTCRFETIRLFMLLDRLPENSEYQTKPCFPLTQPFCFFLSGRSKMFPLSIIYCCESIQQQYFSLLNILPCFWGMKKFRLNMLWLRVQPYKYDYNHLLAPVTVNMGESSGTSYISPGLTSSGFGPILPVSI